ncbi:MAG: hypothetical protein WCQ80_02600 [Bacilli bacterium]
MAEMGAGFPKGGGHHPEAFCQCKRMGKGMAATNERHWKRRDFGR